MMDVALNTLPIIDREAGLKLAGNNQALADDMLAMLINNLPSELAAIQASVASNDVIELKKQLHKLRGGVAYCGLPRIKNILLSLETQVKTQPLEEAKALLQQLNDEITLLLKHYSQ